MDLSTFRETAQDELFDIADEFPSRLFLEKRALPCGDMPPLNKSWRDFAFDGAAIWQCGDCGNFFHGSV